MYSRILILGTLMTLTGVLHPARANEEEQACIAEVADLRVRAATLPQGDLSRRFAEHDLDTALREMAAGDVDECPVLIERARHTITTRPYILRPGETLDGYGPDTRG